MAGHSGRPGRGGPFGMVASVISLFAATLLTPDLWALAEDQVRLWISARYSPDVTYWLHQGAGIAAYPAIFAVCRAAVMGLFLAAAIMLAKRLM